MKYFISKESYEFFNFATNKRLLMVFMLGLICMVNASYFCTLYINGIDNWFIRLIIVFCMWFGSIFLLASCPPLVFKTIYCFQNRLDFWKE